MSWFNPIAKHLYVRIWLAVVAGVALLMLVVGWAWSLSVEHVAQNGPQGLRELQVRNEQGELLDVVPGQQVIYLKNRKFLSLCHVKELFI